MENKKTYIVIGPLDPTTGATPTIVTVVAESFDMINGGPLLSFKDLRGNPVGLHHLAPGHTVTIR